MTVLLMLMLSVGITAFAAESGWKQDEEGCWYYYGSDGEKCHGWLKSGNYWYYLDDNTGAMITNERVYDDINDAYYYLDDQGHMAVNKWTSEYNEKSRWTDWYYYKANGKEASGWEKMGGYWYYFDPLLRNRMVNYCHFYIDGKFYRFDMDGHMLCSQWYKFGSCWYYYKANGTEAKGWEKIGGYWYYFDKNWNNSMLENERFEINGNIYRFDEKGHMVTGWYKDEYDDWYYYEADGAEVSGWKRVGNYWYYFKYDEGNRMLAERWVDDGAYTYYLDKSGHMVSNCWIKGYEDKWYYYKADGVEASGWEKIGGYWYYFDPDNEDVMLCDCTKTIEGVEYTFDASGRWVK